MRKETPTMSNKPAEKKENNRLLKTLLLLLLALLLLLGGVLVYFLWLRPDARAEAQGGKREAAALQGTIDHLTDEEIQAALNDIVDEGMFRISIASDIIAIEDGLAQVRIENNPQNRYVMQVSLQLDETGEEVYATDLIDPGYYIQETKLDKHLEPGKYPATAVFAALYPDTEEVVGYAAAKITIHVFAEGALPTVEPAA